MPFYGRPDQFKSAVASVQAQNDDDWRLTIIDDVYPDPEPARWAERLGDPRIRVLRNDVNLGVGGNFRHAVTLMTHGHAVIMGCDDLMRPGYVARVLELVELFPAAAVIQPGVAVIDDEGNPTRPLADRVKDLYRPRGRGVRSMSGEALAASLSAGNWAYFPSLVWSTAVLKKIGFRPGLEVALDLDLLLRIVATGASLVLDDEVVFDYRRHAGSVSAFTAIDGTRFREERDVLNGAAETFAALGWATAARKARHHLSSRLNALSVLPRAIRTASDSDRRSLVTHILS